MLVLSQLITTSPGLAASGICWSPGCYYGISFSSKSPALHCRVSCVKTLRDHWGYLQGYVRLKAEMAQLGEERGYGLGLYNQKVVEKVREKVFTQIFHSVGFSLKQIKATLQSRWSTSEIRCRGIHGEESEQTYRFNRGLDKVEQNSSEKDTTGNGEGCTPTYIQSNSYCFVQLLVLI